ncbi:MAG: DUF493 domain-containing protein [Victivallaceae bacterium]|nr:DUF493 domain-containing protein [Victivallaceae bacterium]
MGSDVSELKFPVEWHYHIVTDANNVDCEAALNTVLREFDPALGLVSGRSSSGGKYRSFKVSVTFDSREEMEALSLRLGAVKGVKFLL